MNDWTQGYVTEIEYTQGFYKEMAPLNLELAALIKGFDAPPTSRPYHWIEVGCGHGLTANLLAAANPQAKFYALDFNPLHVRNARELAAAGGLANIEFFEDSFEEALQRDLPPMDYFILHGVYSWITPENRAHIVALIRKLLKPGGLVYVSYNCLPGWSGKAPVRRLMTEHAKRRGGPITQRFMAARDFAKSLKEAGCAYFNQHPTAAHLIDHISGQSSNYLVHEYLNEAWELLYHSDVVSEMHGAKVNFIASATLVENADNATIPANLKPLLAQEGDPVMRELIKDFAVNQQFRRDIFARGARRLSPAESLARASALRFCLAAPPEKCNPVIRVPLGEATLQADIFNPIVETLAKGPQTVAALTAATGKDIGLVLNTLTLMAGANYVQPMLADAGQGQKSAAQFNAALIRRATLGHESMALAARNLGNGAQASLLDQLFIAAYQNKAQDAAAFVRDVMLRTGRRPLEDGKAIDDPEKILAHLRTFEADLAPRMALYKTWGVL